MRGKRLSYERIKARYGYVFISLWLVGFILLFAIPFLTTVVYSFSEVKVDPGNIQTKPIGFANYTKLFLGDAEFLPAFTGTITSVLKETPLICVFSLFIAILLNQNFRGRLVARAVFFLPVIIASGVVMDIINGDQFLNIIMTGQRASMLFEADSVQDILLKMGLDQTIIDSIVQTVNRVFYLSWNSGIQILIFLAGLQSIPASLYEVSKVEGANAWVAFWKITLPMIAPMLLVNLIYTVIDNFINPSNAMFKLIQKVSGNIEFAYASAMSILNFLVIFLMIGLIYLILNRRIYYAVD